jgi:hypothetical protein
MSHFILEIKPDNKLSSCLYRMRTLAYSKHSEADMLRICEFVCSIEDILLRTNQSVFVSICGNGSTLLVPHQYPCQCRS